MTAFLLSPHNQTRRREYRVTVEVHDTVFYLIVIVFIIPLQHWNSTWGFAIQGAEPGENGCG